MPDRFFDSTVVFGLVDRTLLFTLALTPRTGAAPDTVAVGAG